MNLPNELRGQYRPVGDLPGGGQALLLLVEDQHGKQFVFKRYVGGLTSDAAVLKALERASEDHVLRIERAGVDGAGHWEVSQYMPHGTLADLLATGASIDTLDVIRQIAVALDHVHGLRLVHSDLKPSNIFVKSIEPLRLVIADWGLVRELTGSRLYTNGVKGTRAYAPPLGEAISPATDWWALGIIAAELLGRVHPWSASNGSLLDDSVIANRLTQGPVPLDHVADPRYRLLCQGLLIRSTTDRWGAGQVKRWFNGESPKVVADTHRLSASSVVLYAGKEYRSRVDLARALQADWPTARTKLGELRDQALVAELKPWLSEVDAAASSVLEGTLHPDVRLLKVLTYLDPNLPPFYDGRSMRPADILDRLSRDPGGEELSRIENKDRGYLVTAVLRMLRALPHMGPEAAALDETLRSTSALLEADRQYVERVRPEQRANARGLCYLAATRPGFASQQLALLNQALTSEAGLLATRQPWWAGLANRHKEPHAVCLSLMLVEDAAQETRIADDAARRQQAELARVAAEERAKQMAEQQRVRDEQAATARAARQVVATQRLDRWTPFLLPVAIWSAVCGIVRINHVAVAQGIVMVAITPVVLALMWTARGRRRQAISPLTGAVRDGWKRWLWGTLAIVAVLTAATPPGELLLTVMVLGAMAIVAVGIAIGSAFA